MSVSDAELSDATQVAVDELLVALKNPSKLTRRSKLESFHKDVVEKVIAGSESVQALYAAISTQLIRTLCDDSEQCRSAAVKVVKTFVEHIKMSDYQLTYIMPAIVKRIGQPEIVEDSEELRLQFIELVASIIANADPQNLEPFVSDFISILVKTCQDPFPEARVEACRCVRSLAVRTPRVFHMQAESLVKPLWPSLAHQRYKVRVAAVETLGALMMHGPSRCLELSVGHLAEKLFDEVQAVREEVLRVTARCLLEHRDRYSYWHRLIPLMLTGLSDSIESVRQESAAAWDRIGLQFMEENHEDLKKMTNFLENDTPEGYPDVPRPNLGCRTIVVRNIGKILPAIERECSGWQEDARYRVVQLLRWLLLCAENGATQHALVAVNILMLTARDEPRITNEMKKAAEYYGIFIEPPTWWPLLKPSIESWSAILVIAYITLGARRQYLKNDGKIIIEMMSEVADADRCQTGKEQHQVAMLCLCENVMRVLEKDAIIVKDDLFTILFSVYSLSEGERRERALECLKTLSGVSGHSSEDVSGLFGEQAKRAVSQITSDPLCWNVAHPYYSMLYTLLTLFGSAVSEITSELSELLCRVLSEEKLDGAVKVKLFNALSMMLIDKDDNFKTANRDELMKFYRNIWNEVISQQLVWKAGATAEAVRCAAISCACCLLQTRLDGGDDLSLLTDATEADAVTEQISTLAPSLLDDRCETTRLRTVDAILLCAEGARRSGCLSIERLHKMYYGLLKHLDDACSSVRFSSARALPALFRCRPSEYDTTQYGAHIDALYSTMLIHLDDPDDAFRAHILKCLLQLKELDPELLLRKLEKNMALYANKDAFQTLQQSIANLSIQC